MPPRVSGDIIPHDIWERIAFFANVSKETSFLGPPSAIPALSLLSHRVHEAISWKSNPHLYARIFRYKFDYSAPTRRFSARWLTSRCLTSEMIKRFKALKRIKAGQLYVHDLWTAYLMILENDGKNKAQLLEYSGFDKYLRSVIIYRIAPGDELGWFKNAMVDTLVLWLLWSISDRDQPRREAHEYREYLIGILHSVVISGYRHSSVYASDLYYTLPICQNAPFITGPGVIPPPVCELEHYSHRLKLSAPVISSAATLLLALHADAFQDESAFPHVVRNGLLLTRADAIAQGRTGPTVEDVEEFHFNVRIPTMAEPLRSINRTPNNNIDEPIGASDDSAGGSHRYDSDWYRLVACHDIRAGETTLRGVIYTPGTMTGSWEGRLMRADYALYASLLRSQTNPSTISIRHTPLYWELQEHHCLTPNEPLEPGLDGEHGEDILNAWLPRGAVFAHLEDAVEVFDPNTGHTARYETFVPRSAAPYSKRAMEKVQRSWILVDGEIAENPTLSVFGSGNLDSSLPSATSIDNDDEFSDTLSFLSSGVSDILITGKTGERYAPAWGNYTIYGRVRPWDGLVALLRFPTNPEEHYLGTWVFKGYVHDRNFVGRWRETSTPVNLIGYEGSFVVYRNDPVDST